MDDHLRRDGETDSEWGIPGRYVGLLLALALVAGIILGLGSAEWGLFVR
jgi:hypothetical protein